MAYMSQEKKAEIRAELKKVMPKTWKWTLGVNHHTSIVLTIWSAPVDLVKEASEVMAIRRADACSNPPTTISTMSDKTYLDVNQYHLDGQFTGKRLKTFEKIKAALNAGNHNRSEPQTDYFDVGWYVDINLGRFDKPFEVAR